MTSQTINAHCKICGRGYHVCSACLGQKTFRPWRTIADTVEHYKIYLTIHSYSVSGNRELARAELLNSDLSETETFLPEIQSVIHDILEHRPEY